MRMQPIIALQNFGLLSAARMFRRMYFTKGGIRLSEVKPTSNLKVGFSSDQKCFLSKFPALPLDVLPVM